jgi:hypothetical protein
MHATSSLEVVWPVVALIMAAVTMGGGIYEASIVDPAWPQNPSIIQKDRGGIVRGRFWVVAHILYELILVITLLMLWSVSTVRWWIIGAIVIQLAARVWSMIYFIPKALRFEKLGDLTKQQTEEAQRWTRMSRLRLVPAAAGLVVQSIVVIQLAAY